MLMQLRKLGLTRLVSLVCWTFVSTLARLVRASLACETDDPLRVAFEMRKLAELPEAGPYMTMARKDKRQALRFYKKSIAAAVALAGHIFQPHHIAAITKAYGDDLAK